jgi:transcriptional regulator GlxA family with amidase domain
MENEELSPLSSELSTEQDETAQDRFADIMLKIIPYVKDKQSYQLTMVKLSELAQVDVDEFFQIMSGNLYKSPRIVALKLRLQHVAEMLKNSEKSVDEIAEELHFASPNFMIARFYHLFRMTPDAYRANNPR